MRGTVAAILALAASTAQAIQITYPTENATIDASSGLTITWDTVSTDPSTVDITLVGTSNGQQTTETIASGVSTSSGSYTVKSLDASGSGFQIDLVSVDPKNTGILAQSQQFIVDSTGSSSSSSASSASSTASTLSTSTTSGSSTASGSSASSSASAAAASSASASGSSKSSSTASGSSASSTGASASSTDGSSSSSSASATGSSASASATSSSSAASTLQIWGGAGALLMAVAALL